MRGGKVKHVRKALMLTLLTLTALSLLTPYALADYTEESTDLYGDWISYYPDNFRANNDSQGHWGALYDPAQYNFSAVHYRINLTDFGATLRSWSFSDYKKVTVRMDITAGVFWGDFNINMTATNQISWWGLTNDISLTFGGSAIGQWRELTDIYIIRTGNDTCTVRISLWDLTGGTTLLPNGTEIQGYNVYWEKDYTLSEDFFTYPIVGSLYVEHEGSGHFDFSVETTWYTDGALPDIVEGINVPETVNRIEDWWQGVIDFFYGGLAFISNGITFIIELAGIVGNVAVSIAPYLGLILVFYLIDVGVTSARERSFTPVGTAFTKMYEFLMLIWGALIDLGGFIWDVITFWN